MRYLGIQLDKCLYYNEHVNEIIRKAQTAFFTYKSFFYSKYIKTSVKIIMYKSLIRPILTYGCPIWYNISPSYMEKLRVFERKCLRACTSLFRSADSNFLKYVSNKNLYNKSNIVRIDNFIISLIRNYIVRSTSGNENNLIMAPYFTDFGYIENALQKGLGPPESFLYLDKLNKIQDENGVPIFYHNYRRANDKAVNTNLLNISIRFDRSLSDKEIRSRRSQKSKKYWWLD